MSRLHLHSFNVNGIRAAHRKGLLDYINNKKPDILAIQETKAHESQLPFDLLHIDNYHSFFADARRKGYSGVALYTKLKPRLIKRGFGINRFDIEGRVIEAHYDNFILLNIYFPNGKASQKRLDYKLDFYHSFLDYLLSLYKKNKNIIFCGDVNTAHKSIDLARPRANQKTSGFLSIEREWIDRVISEGFIDIFRHFHQEPDQYSWWSMRTRARERNVGWRIDYFFVSQHLVSSIADAYILPEVTGSDHCPVGIELKI